MYCKNCGSICNNTDTKCPNCGKSLEASFYGNNIPEVRIENIYTKEDKDKANLISALSLLFFLLPFLLNALLYETELINIIGNISGLLELVSFSLMIYVRVKYPKNILGKVLMWLYIVSLILFIILIAIFLIACVTVISSCPG